MFFFSFVMIEGGLRALNCNLASDKEMKPQHQRSKIEMLAIKSVWFTLCVIRLSQILASIILSAQE